MQKKFCAIAAALALGGLLAVSGSAFAAKGFQHLSFMGSYLEKHPTVVNVWKPWFKVVEEKFPGKLSFDYFGQGHLYPEAEGLSAISDGRVDFGTLRPSVFPGKMNLLAAPALPGMCPNAIVGSLVTEDLIRKFEGVRAEFPKGTRHCFSWASAAYQLHTIKPVKSLADVKGLKIIAWDATTLEYVKALGANAIRLSSPDSYLALSKGMADGVLCPLAPLRSYKITEATKNHLLLDLGINTFCMEANEQLWNDMPADMRTWLDSEFGMKMALAAGKSLEDGAKRDIEWMKAQGHQFFPISDEDRAEMLKNMAKFADLFKTSECKGMDPKLVEDVLNYTRERSAFYQAEMKAGKYGDYGM
ncbi:MAG: TRAP transporter substrate-binding protein DctP [Mailhella sp.]|nr:TRAP transporter substrate-binding protein DctP [Mailhella sp.]